MLLEVNDLKKIYGKGGNETIALTNVNFSVKAGEFVAIMGESGSGKSTLLNIIATLDTPTQGHVLINGQDTKSFKEEQLAAFRRNHLGFVFQEFNVLDNLSNKDNILLPMVLSQKSVQEMESALFDCAPSLGIEELLNKFPYQVSGGQKQRVAIGRAIITQPELLLADEPTGALDSKTSDQIMQLFQTINQRGQTILMVTHSIQAASYASRILFIKDGSVYQELYRGDDDNQSFKQRIADNLSFVIKG